MNRFKEETEYDATHIPMFRKVVDMFEGSPDFQRIVKLGLLANMNYSDDLDEVDYNYDRWVHGHSSTGYGRHSDRSSDRELHGNRTRSSSSVYQLPLHYYSAGFGRPCPPFIKVQAKESDTEWRARLLQEAKKKEEKAEKKRLKKQKQKERKRCEKLEKEKLSPVKSEEESGDAPQNSKKVIDESKSSVKDLASAKDAVSSSSEDESSDEDGNTRNDMDDCEELDMSSVFVSKAAFIAKRKLEQKQKKTSPVKEEPKAVPDKPNEDPETEKKDSAATSNPTLEDNVKKSTNLASIGNKYADAGDFYMAVQYFTDAIKFNPTEIRLFGNRSFCFEKMQEYEKALTDAELSLSMCPTFVKGLFRKGRALAGLKRYDEAAQAFREVLKLDGSCAEAAQELMRVQTTQLMEYGLTREQSSNALIIHGTVQKAVEVLFKVNQPGATQNSTVPLAQVANVSGVSPVLSAHINPAFPQPQDAPNSPLKYKPVGAVQTMSNGDSQPKPSPHQAMKTTSENIGSPQELYPVWVGNLVNPVTEASLTNLFNKVGVVHSAKLLMFKRCAFVNFTKQEYCEEAIRHFHGFELNGNRIAVRYPDRIPHGMGISKSALIADDFDNVGRNAVGSRRPAWPYKHVPDYRDGRRY